MGNAQSSGQSPQPMKITKPRTNKSTTNLLLRPPSRDLDVPSLVTTPTTALSAISDEDVVVASASGDRRTRKDARQRLKTQLFSSGGTSPRDEVQGEGLSAMMTGIRDRLSRSSSSRSHGSSTVVSCLGDSRLSSSAAEGSSEDSAYPVQLLDGPGPEVVGQGSAPSKHRLSLWSLRKADKPDLAATRRRSMFTPGVATRTTAVDLLSDEPPLLQICSPADRDYFSNHLPAPEMPPRSMLAALDLADDGGPRASTPCDLDYTHLGCFKPGTLRITNGAASPVPSTVTPGPRSHVSEDFPRREGYPSSPDALSTSRAICDRVDGEPPLSDADGPCTAAELAETKSSRNLRVDTRLRAPAMEPKRTVHSGATNDDVFARETGVGSSPSGQWPLTEAASSTPSDRTSDIAREYMNELASSPFPAERTPSTNSWMNSKFEDEGYVPSPSRQIPGGVEKDWSAAAHLSSGSSSDRSQASSFDFSPQDGNPQRGKPSGKADSGYSSTLSLRSLHDDGTIEAAKAISYVFRPASSIYTVDFNGASTQPRVPLKTPPPLPPKLHLPDNVAPLCVTPPVPPKDTVARQSQEAEKSPPVPPKSDTQMLESNQRPSFPTRNSWGPGHPLPSVHRSNAGLEKSLPQTPEKPARSQPRKLHKSPPAPDSTKTPVTVQVSPKLENSQVPPVPSDVIARSTGRLRMPSALARSSSEVISAQPATDSRSRKSLLARVSFPIADDEEAEEPALEMKKLTSEHRNSGFGLISRTVRRYKSDPRLNSYTAPATAAADDEDEPEVIPNLEMVIGSLGRGPYDAAMPATSKSKRPRQGSEKLYPHQIGRMQKSRSMVGMDSEAAAVLARQRSKDIGKLGSRPGASRPHSICLSEFDADDDEDRSGRRNKLSRRRSLVDAPPVPSVPAVHLRDSKLHQSATSPPDLLGSKTDARLSRKPRDDDSVPSRAEGHGTDKNRKRARQLRRRTAGAELLGRYKGMHSLQCQPILENPGQEGSKASAAATAGAAATTGAAGSGSGRRYKDLLRAHGLDLSDVPISVKA